MWFSVDESPPRDYNPVVPEKYQNEYWLDENGKLNYYTRRMLWNSFYNDSLYALLGTEEIANEEALKKLYYKYDSMEDGRKGMHSWQIQLLSQVLSKCNEEEKIVLAQCINYAQGKACVAGW